MGINGSYGHSHRCYQHLLLSLLKQVWLSLLGSTPQLILRCELVSLVGTAAFEEGANVTVWPRVGVMFVEHIHRFIEHGYRFIRPTV